MSSLVGKTVLIFGGSSGMGKATARGVLNRGGIPFIVSRTESKLKQAQEEISPKDPSLVKYAAVDVYAEDNLIAFFDAQPAGSFHHIVATLGEGVSCSDIRGKEGLALMKKQFDVKFFAQLATLSFGVDKMADGGSVVVTSGALARRPGKGSTALAACNAALEAVIKGLANDWGPRVRVNCISPGLTRTEMWSSMPPEQLEGMLTGFSSLLPLKRPGESEDVGEAICFLLTATYTTGCTLDCDGGATIRP
jgi:NAD(P)-dependent dehydrogenase (short-subunit alcohol dehydrogenase family)